MRNQERNAGDVDAQSSGSALKIEQSEPPELSYLSYLSQIPQPIPFAEFSGRLQALNDPAVSAGLFQSFDNNQTIETFENECRLTRRTAEQFRDRHRYGNVLPYDQSLVVLGYSWRDFKLNHKNPFEVVDMGQHYINASYIRRPIYNNDGRALGAPYAVDPEYIATQAPLINTIADFLLMVFEQRSPLIIMLCQPEERALNKYSQYWPDDGIQTFVSGRCSVDVRKMSEENQGSVCVRRLMILPKGMLEPWEVTHYQYLAWPYQATPQVEPFYELIIMHLNFTRTHPVGDIYGPTVVHCSAGVGRTGTLITARFALERLRANPEKIDIIGTIMAIRKFRCMMVQVHTQMRFIHEFIQYCITKEHITSSPKVPSHYPALPIVQSGGEYTNLTGADKKQDEMMPLPPPRISNFIPSAQKPTVPPTSSVGQTAFGNQNRNVVPNPPSEQNIPAFGKQYRNVAPNPPSSKNILEVLPPEIDRAVLPPRPLKIQGGEYSNLQR
ncbi:hypothetical protein Aperf_G00000121679 [Anoplocephala perfoliata]